MAAGKVWFTSDLHFGHRKVAEIRGFETPLDHDLSIFDSWLAQVGPKDQVWVLGDIEVGDGRHALATLAGLPGEKHLVWGNHDRGHPMHRDAHRKAGQYLKVFASVQMAARRRINGQSVLVSHFPYAGDTKGRERDRYPEWRFPLEGQPLDEVAPVIHGHTHRAERFSWAVDEEVWTPGVGDDHEQFGAQVHVGWDAWQRPVSLDEIAALLP